MTIRIVTDSTCDLPEATAAEHSITIVPAYVNIGDKSYLDGVELSRQEFYEELPNYPSPPTTAAPAPGTFTEKYNKLAAEGATEILSIHVASKLSGIFNAARIGAEATDNIPVTVVDSQQLTMGHGLLAIVAAEAAVAGRSMAEILAMLEARIPDTYVIGVLGTLEYLRRGGRVSWAQFGLGTLLRIKPLFQVNMGEVEIVERVRTNKRAIQRLLEVAAELGPLENMALLHTHAAERIPDFRVQTNFLAPDGLDPLAVEITPTVGAHLGPGALGIACIVASK